MNGIVIGASGESIHAITQAKELGLHVIAFDGDKNAQGLSIADEAYVVDIKEPENIYAVIDKKNKINKENRKNKENISQENISQNIQNMVVIPVPIGRYLISTGSFNEHYGLLGPKRQTTEICTDKWLFHQTLSEQKLRNIKCTLIKAGQKQYEQDSFPVIVKPRFGAGSREVRQISSSSEWKEVKLPFDEDFIIEDAVQGTEYGIDGMVINGKFHLVLIRKKINTPLPYRQCVGYVSAQNDVIPQYMEKLITAIRLDDGILHADLIYDEATGPFVIEMSARPSGHRLHDIFTPLVTGVDMVREYLKYAMTGNFNIPASKSKSASNSILTSTSTSKQNQDSVFMIRYFDIEREIKRIPSEDYLFSKYPALMKYECNMQKGDIAKIVDGHSLMDRGFFILKGKSEEALCNTANNILSEYV